MAKALLGHLGPDPYLAAEVASLRRRVADLEDEVGRLAAVNEALTGMLTGAEVVLEPAMAAGHDRSPVPA